MSHSRSFLNSERVTGKVAGFFFFANSKAIPAITKCNAAMAKVIRYHFQSVALARQPIVAATVSAHVVNTQNRQTSRGTSFAKLLHVASFVSRQMISSRDSISPKIASSQPALAALLPPAMRFPVIGGSAAPECSIMKCAGEIWGMCVRMKPTEARPD